MKILTTIHGLDRLKLIKHVDGFIVGNKSVSVRLTSSFEVNEINRVIEYCFVNRLESFVLANKMFKQQEFGMFKEFIKSLQTDLVTGIIVGDLGALNILDEMGLSRKAVYNPNTLNTNYVDFNFLKEYKIKGSFVANEITLEDILKIGQNKQYKMFLVGHGHVPMFYSIRPLVSNFKEQYGLKFDEHSRKLTLTESKRDDRYFPILEDDNGTYVFRDTVLTSFNCLEQLETVVDYFVVNTLFKDDEYGTFVAELYKNKRHDKRFAQYIKERYDETWDDGFYDLKTVLLKEEAGSDD